MPESTTIAETLCHVFTKLHKTIPANQSDGTSLLTCWTRVLGGPDRGPFDVIASIGQICSLVGKLEAQINASVRLRDTQKKSALSTLSSFQPLFDLKIFNQASFHIRGSCNEHQTGLLEIVGHSLAPEFSEPLLEKPDAEDLTSALDEVKKMLADSSISLDLRVSLTKHVDVMIWWLAHPEMASLQDLFETMGSAMVIARQMRDRDPEHDSSAPTVSKGIYERVMAAATKLGKLVGLVTRGVEAYDALSGDVHQLLENLTPPS